MADNLTNIEILEQLPTNQALTYILHFRTEGPNNNDQANNFRIYANIFITNNVNYRLTIGLFNGNDLPSLGEFSVLTYQC